MHLETYEGTFHDYAEAVVQFGYVNMFSVVRDEIFFIDDDDDDDDDDSNNNENNENNENISMVGTGDNVYCFILIFE